MTSREFTAWAAHTDRSRKGWQLDLVTFHNTGHVLMYHGGEAGTYIEIIAARVTVGTYVGAIPHIGEAIFKPEHRKEFSDESEAFATVSGATSINNLIAKLGIPS